MTFDGHKCWKLWLTKLCRITNEITQLCQMKVNVSKEPQNSPRFFQLKLCPSMSFVLKRIKPPFVRIYFADEVHFTTGAFINRCFNFNIFWAGTFKELSDGFRYAQISACRKIDQALQSWLHPAEGATIKLVNNSNNKTCQFFSMATIMATAGPWMKRFLLTLWPKSSIS